MTVWLARLLAILHSTTGMSVTIALYTNFYSFLYVRIPFTNDQLFFCKRHESYALNLFCFGYTLPISIYIKKNTSKQVKQCIETAETVKNMVMTWCIIEHVLLHTIIIIFFDSVLKQKMTWLGRLGTYWLLRVFYYRLLYYSKKKTPKLNRIKKATIVLLFADTYFILWTTQINYYSVRVNFFNAH